VRVTASTLRCRLFADTLHPLSVSSILIADDAGDARTGDTINKTIAINRMPGWRNW
jgi:hypothetical protein